jgi:GntR family transcriptional regulator
LTDLRTRLHVAIDGRTGVPLYVQLREKMRAAILAGEWNDVEPLPPEEALAADLGVSRSTVRQALDDLRREGLIVRHPGRGSFVRQARMVLRMQQFVSFRDEMRERGLEPSSRLVAVQAIPNDRERLGLDVEHPGERVIWVRTVRLANDAPALLFDHYFPARRCGFLMREPLDAPDLSLRQLLEAHGIVPFASSGEVRAARLDCDEAELLECEKAEPVIEITTRTADPNGRTFEFARSLIRSDRYALLLQSDWTTTSGL